ncbi:MAG: outer membrane lipoprotein-sorting protein [Actinomycetota bacterium]
MGSRFRLFIFMVSLPSLVPFVQAQAPSANEIIRRTEQLLRAKTQEGSVSMTVRTPDWQRTLEMNYWSVNPDKTFIRVTSPAKEAGTSTLRLGSNMWNYLPSVERTIKIPPSLMLQPWMGSDFTNDDLTRESSLEKDYTHRVEGEEKQDGDLCYRIYSTPKPNAPVVWGHLVVFVRKSNDLPRREEFYDEKGVLQKVLTFEDVRTVDGRVYPMRWKMVSATKPGHETILLYRTLKFDRAIAPSVFTKDNLQQPF